MLDDELLEGEEEDEEEEEQQFDSAPVTPVIPASVTPAIPAVPTVVAPLEPLFQLIEHRFPHKDLDQIKASLKDKPEWLIEYSPSIAEEFAASDSEALESFMEELQSRWGSLEGINSLLASNSEPLTNTQVFSFLFFCLRILIMNICF